MYFLNYLQWGSPSLAKVLHIGFYCTVHRTHSSGHLFCMFEIPIFLKKNANKWEIEIQPIKSVMKIAIIKV